MGTANTEFPDHSVPQNNGNEDTINTTLPPNELAVLDAKRAATFQHKQIVTATTANEQKFFTEVSGSLNTKTAEAPKSPEATEKAGEERWLANGIEWLQKKLKGSQNSLIAVVLLALDYILGYVKPDENGGIQSRDDLLDLADDLVANEKEGESSPEEKEKKLKQIEHERFMLHKNNTEESFKQAVESGKNLEFDVRSSGEGVVIRHNRESQTPEVTFRDFIDVMKKNPGWSGKMEIDIKDRKTVEQLNGCWNEIPANFRQGVMIGTFDPEVVMQAHEKFNLNKNVGERVPIVLHVLPLMRYSDANTAKTAVGFFNKQKSLIQNTLGKMVGDTANNPLAETGNTMLYTSYEDFQNTQSPKGNHILTLENPIAEIKEKDKRVLDAILYSGGEFSFPYDPKYLNWVKNNSEKTGVGFKNVGVGFLNTTPDDLYDALKWQDMEGNRIARISVDSEKI